MENHASMNRIYRLVWNAALNLWVAVAENAKGCGKGGSTRGSVAVTSVGPRQRMGFALNSRCRAAMILLLSLSVGNLQVHAADANNATLVVGTGNVSTAGLTTTINQASQRLAIDWTSLSTAANEALVFNQPNAAAIALNRITGASPSALLGSLTANGQVFILNPNGVLFGAGSQVNVGGLVASTLSMSNADFMAGNNTFSNSGSSGSVVNQGTLNAAPGGYLALLAPEVRNEGVMTASLGTALLAAGNKVTLNLDNGSLLGYSIDQGAINALAENKQLIQADGGQVLLSARAMDSLTTATVNNTGIIEAHTLQNKAGRILLIGDMQYGTVNVGGTLDASAPNGGDGGFIETSAANFTLAPDLKIKALAPQGKAGKWLLDPTSITIAGGTGAAANTIYEDAIEVAGADVSIQATDTITVSGTFSNADVAIADGLNLTIQTTGSGGGTGIDLTGSAHGADLTFKTSVGGSVNMSTGNAAQTLKTSAISVTGGGTINLNSAGVLDIRNTTLQTDGGAITLTGAGTSLADGVKISKGIVNAGTGALTITGSTTSASFGVNIENALGESRLTGGTVNITGSTTGGDYGVRIDRSTVSASNGLTLDSATGNSRMYLQGATLDATGGNILIKAKGASTAGFFQSLLIEDVSGTRSNIRNTGSGNITIDAQLTSHASSTGTPSALLVRNSDITAGAGAISLTGATGTSGVVDGTTGVLLASGAKVSGAGNISITGTAGSTANVNSYGVNLLTGSEVSSTGGNVAITGTFNNPASLTGTGVRVAGKVQSGAGGSITLTGNATVGGSSGTGVFIDTGANLIAGTGGLTIVGTTSSATTATNVIGTSMDAGTISSTGAVAITGNLNGGSIAVGRGLLLQGGSINANGANITLRGSGVPAPAPASAYDLNITGTTVTSAGGVIQLLGDRVNIASAVNAGAAGRVVIAPTSTSRQITLAGLNEAFALNLSASEINQITAGELQIGTANNLGGIEIGSNGGVIAPAPSPLPFISLLTATSINQTGAIRVSKLSAVGASVNLGNAGNEFDEVSGSASSGAFTLTSGKAGPLAVGAISATTNVTLNATADAITDNNGATNNITAATFNASGASGITLGTNVSGLQTLATTDTAGDISISAANALSTSKLSVSTNAGAAQTVSLSSNAGITVDTAFGNAQDNFKLTATGGNLNVNAALSASKLTLSTAGTSAQTAAITASGLELLGSGSHTLNNAGNAVTTVAGNTGSVNYSQVGALTIGTVNTVGLASTGKVLVRTTGAAGDLTVANAVSAGSTASDALVLASGRNFINSSGSATPLSTGSGGRYLVYSVDPTANSLGTMVSSGNAFNRTYAANGPTDASMTSIAGNRFVYSIQPTLNITADNQTKAYGGTDPTLTYMVNSGLVAGDTAASALGGALSAPTGAATTGPTHAITQGTLASSIGYAINYTNGTLTVTGTPPAPVSIPVPVAPATQSTVEIAALGGSTLVPAYKSAIETITASPGRTPGASGAGGSSSSSGNEGNSGGGSASLDPGGATLNAAAEARESDGDKQ